MLQAQQTAPTFTTITQDQHKIDLNDYIGKHQIVLYFYPKDDTPGCTIEANDFTALINQFTAANTKVFGVSRDNCASHQAFIDKFGLKIDLLADTDGSLCESYGVWQQKEKNGETYMGIVRSTFVIDLDGRLSYVEYGVNPEGHAQKILQLVEA